jgi:hypothetical protein
MGSRHDDHRGMAAIIWAQAEESLGAPFPLDGGRPPFNIGAQKNFLS